MNGAGLYRALGKLSEGPAEGVGRTLAERHRQIGGPEPPPARGKRQFQEETKLAKAADAILKAHEVEGLLTYTFERQEKRPTKYLGRGRGSSEHPKHEIVTVR